MKKTLVMFLLSASLAGQACAQSVEEKRIQDSSGLSTLVPATYQVKQDASGTVVVEPNQNYLVVIKHHPYPSFEAFAAQANLEKDGFALVGDIQQLNTTDRAFRAARPNGSSNLIADTFVTFSPQGGGSLIVALSDDQHANAAFQSALRMSRSVQYPAGGIQASASPWDQALRGKHLLFLYTSSGFSERVDIYLHHSGAFTFRLNSSSLSANGSGAVGGNSDGQWQITSDGRLVLQFHNGRVNNYTLAPRQASNEVSLNGKRYFVMND